MRIFYYSHDTYGLGHIQRTLAIARQVALDCPEATQLLVTGSPQAHSFELPDRLDIIKLPSITKSPEGGYCSRTLQLPFKTLKALREILILEAIRHFKPDIVLVDKAPAGVKGEMRPALSFLKEERPETKLVLGMRDIEDDAEKVCETWKQQGLYRLMDETYDAILLYGNRSIYDPIKAYRLSARTENKIISCGYIGREKVAKAPEAIREALKMKTNRLVVVTAGGGEDGFQLMHTYLKMFVGRFHANHPGFDSLLVLGPLMAKAERKQLHAYCQKGFPVSMLDFSSDLYSSLNAADLIVSMGGYNSFCEIMSLKKQAIIVPRIKPRIEQLIRAQCFSARGLVQMLHPEHLKPENLLSEIRKGFQSRGPVFGPATGLTMDGAMNASQALIKLFNRKKPLLLSRLAQERLKQEKQEQQQGLISPDSHMKEVCRNA
ncbi:MAG: glycosyltransferase [Nitrospirae bacterium]|nr:glycosyltransferase [Candidatus Manganitrophaceae bacterium]